MSYTPHTETLGGLTLKIVLDDHGGTDSPIEHDEAVIFAVLHHRYFNPAKDITIEKPEGSEESFYDFTTEDGIAEFEKDNAGDDAAWAVFPLYMYDHSGTIYKASEGGNPFHCRWDSGRVGIIALKKSDVGTPGKEYGEGKHKQVGKSYLEQANATCEGYTEWANGEIFGYVVEDETGEELESCWGFIGSYDSYVLEEGRRVLKSLLKDHEPKQEFVFSRTEADAIVTAMMHVMESEFVCGAKRTDAERITAEKIIDRIQAEFPFKGYTAAEVAESKGEEVR